MITLHIARNGQNEGISMLAESPQKFNTFNPYNTFFSPTEDEMDIVRDLWKEAGEIYGHNYTQYFVPQHLIMIMGMLVHFREAKSNDISYPECAVLPAVQSIFFIFMMLLTQKYNGNVYVYTLSEYMIRCSQLMVADKRLDPSTEIKILDDDNNGEEFTSEYITDRILGCHDYENSSFSIK